MSSTTINSSDRSGYTVSQSAHPEGFTLRRKIITGFSGLILLMTFLISFTLYKLTTIEESTISVIETQQPTAILIVSLSEDLNFAISLLNEYILSGDDDDISEYPLIEQRLFVYLEKIEESITQENNTISTDSINKLKSLLEIFSNQGSKLISLRNNPTDNYPGLVLADETLLPIHLEYIGLINELIDQSYSEKNTKLNIKTRNLLYQARYSWTQVVTNMRLFANRGTDNSLTNIGLYADLNNKVLKKLSLTKIDFGFDSIDALIDFHKEYFKYVPIIVDYRRSNRWRTDMFLMRTEVKPLVEELRSLLVNLVDSQIDATEQSGHSLTSSMEQIRVYTTTLFVFALISGLILSYLITRGILPPIRELMEVAKHVANGDLNAEAHIKTKDEIGLLGISFNAMIDALRAAEIEKDKIMSTLESRVAIRTSELEKSEARIRAIYDNIGEGIIVINQHGFIDSINSAAQNIFNVDNKQVIGMHAILLLDNQEFSNLAESDNYNDEKDGPFKTSLLKKSIETVGRRMDGSVFPMEMVVTRMNLGENHMRACIVRDITDKKEAEEKLKKAQRNIVDQAHKSGMAEIATGVLHNIGNILNSVNVSVEQVYRIARDSKINSLIKANSLLSENMDNIDEFLTSDKKGKKLPEYYVKIGNIIENEIDKIVDEALLLSDKTTMMREVISTQQAYATAGSFIESFQVKLLIDDAVKVEQASLDKWNITLSKSYSKIPDVSAQKSKLLQVIINLVKNAKEATSSNDKENKKKEIAIVISKAEDGAAIINVTDNGCGINPDNLSNIFVHGYTTKKNGHGFGLHTCANYMTEMGGSLSVSSEGLKKGSCFTVKIPIAS